MRILPNPNHSAEDPVPSSPSTIPIMPKPTRAMIPSRHQYSSSPLRSIPENTPSTVFEGEARTSPTAQEEDISQTIALQMKSTMVVVTPPSSRSTASHDSTMESSSSTGVTTPMVMDKRDFFRDLPSNVADRMLEFVFVRDASTIIRPFYRKGMLAGSIRTGNDIQSQETGDEVLLDNVDLSLTRVSKQFRDGGSRYFYGKHTFHFQDPAACKWWFKTVGNQNVSNVRSLSLRMGSGFTVPPNIRCTLDLTLEERWHQFFCWIKNRQNLTNLRIEFYYWSTIEERHLENEWKQEIHTARTKLLAKMRCLRGIEEVEVFDHTGHYMTTHGCRLLELQLMQGKDEDVRPDQRNKPLSQVMEELRESRARAEVMQQIKATADQARMQERKRPRQWDRNERQALGVSNTQTITRQNSLIRTPDTAQAIYRPPTWYSRVPARATGQFDNSTSELFPGRTPRSGGRSTYSKKNNNNRSGWRHGFDLDL
ncbi:hypothetical protein EDD37DRAFT_321978 [Exophiala viscosa]|uniref:uncharacterized protein n=1 Tax=Exophiala viscosa TaxID=2486360 RepID=UPI002197CC70|nr:hypothetical protein EDD37DRAFT_321978 [Exophiala viscosa]